MHYFNSIKVQLEHMVSFAQVALCLLFQFHKGTIRTINSRHYCWCRLFVISIP